MSSDASQSKIRDYRNIIKYHGIINGCRRAFDQFTQNDWYDLVNKTNFSKILAGDSFYNSANGNNSAMMHYQPVYTAAIKKPLLDLVRNHPVVGASSTCFLDLGCGRGKALHVAKSTLQHVHTIGVELNSELLADARVNVEKVLGNSSGTKASYVESDVNHVDYQSLLSSFDVVIVFNKNSFDKATTENTLKKIKQACQNKVVFYIYSNPVFEDAFDSDVEVFSMHGWHKNWNTKVFKVNTSSAG